MNIKLKPKKMFALKWLVAFFLITLSLLSLSFSFADEPAKRVLILMSYSPDYKWTGRIEQGIRDGLRGFPNTSFRIEYMDTKRINDERHFRNLYALYKNKFTGHEFDVIISADDDAYRFLLKNRDALFPGIPIVFCGVSGFKESDIAGQSGITGVVEDYDIKSTLDVAFKLHPETKEVFVITDRTKSGKINLERTRRIIPKYMNSAKFTFLDNLKAEELKEKVQTLPKDSFILFLNFNRDKAGRVFTYEEAGKLLKENNRVPIYTCWDTRFENTALGGMITSGYYQGKTAGEMARRILQGEKAESIPVLKESPNRYMFDYREMKRFQIKKKSLPEGSIIVNEPLSFYSVNKETLFFSVVLVAFLSFVIFILAMNILGRTQAEKRLLLTQFSVDRSGDAAFWVNPDARFFYVNEAACRLFGYSREEFLSMSVHDIDPKYPKENWKEHWETMKKKQTLTFESLYRKKNGEDFPVELTINYVEFNGKEYNCAFARDITERKKAEKEIIKSLREKKLLLSEIHHRVKNNMQVISSILSLQSAYTDDDKTTSILEECQDRIKSMALIHEKLYEADDFASVRFKEYIELLTQNLMSSYRKDSLDIALKSDIEDIFLDLDTAIPLGLIINELVSNALKHAFHRRSKGEMRIALHSIDDGGFQLIIADNGCGLPEGLDVKKSESLGLHIVSLLVEQQLRGEIKITRNHGTEFEIIFQKIQQKKRP